MSRGGKGGQECARAGVDEEHVGWRAWEIGVC
ncbi:unnamed protein product, partial [Gulo gulo]